MEPVFEMEINVNRSLLMFMIYNVLLVFAFFFLALNHLVEEKMYLFLLIIIFSFIYLPWKLFCSVKIILTADKLILEKRIAGFVYHRDSYPLSEISVLRRKSNERSETLTGFENDGRQYGLHKLIMDYYTNPSVIYFSYGIRKLKIGLGLEAFDAEGVIKEIKMRKAAIYKASKNS